MVNFCESIGCNTRLVASSPGFHVQRCAKCYKAGKYEVKTVKSRVHTCINFEKFEISIPLYSAVPKMSPVDERVCTYSYITEDIEIVEPIYTTATSKLQDVMYYDVVTVNGGSLQEVCTQTDDPCIEDIDLLIDTWKRLISHGHDALKLISILNNAVSEINMITIQEVSTKKVQEKFGYVKGYLNTCKDVKYLTDLSISPIQHDMYVLFEDNIYGITQSYNLTLYESLQYSEEFPVVPKSSLSSKSIKYQNYPEIMNSTESYGNIQSKDSKFYRKVIIDNDLHFTYNKDDFTFVYYDIETACISDQTKIPIVGSDSIIGCLCAVSIYKGEVEVHAWCLDQYTVDYGLLDKLVKEYTEVTCKVIQVSCDSMICMKFIEFLANMTTTCIVSGFNSNIGKRDDTMCGYDLPMIISKAPCILTPNYFYCKYNGLEYQQIGTIRELRKCYFVDSMLSLFNALVPLQKPLMENYKLDSYLSLTGIANKKKLWEYAELQRKLLTKGTNLEQVLNYCIYDCFALYLLEERLQGIGKLLEIGKLLDVPLTSALFNTQAQNITLKLMRMFDSKGYVFMYNRPVGDRQSFQGAHTYTHDDFKCKVVTGNIFDLDYTSLYPSSIISGNLSPETYIPPSKLDQYDPSQIIEYRYDDKKLGEQVIHFVKQEIDEGIIPKYLAWLLDERARIKKQMKIDTGNYGRLDMEQYAIKIVANSIYGLTGSRYFPIFCKEVAMSCTYLGRKAIGVAHELCRSKEFDVTVILEDTDSVMAVFKDKEQYDRLRDNIQETLGSRFVLDYVTTFTHYMASKANKSYIALDEKGELCVKGVSWSLYTNTAKEMIKELLKTVLISGDVYSSVKSFYSKHKLILIEALNRSDWRAIIQPYTSIIKTNSKSALAKALKERYSSTLYKEDRIYTVEINATGKGLKLVDKVYSLYDESITANMINVNRLLTKFMSSIHKLTFKFEDASTFTGDGLVYYREERHVGNSVIQFRDQCCSIDEYIDLLKGSVEAGISYHETFNLEDRYRIFIDIDKCDKQKMYDILRDVNEVLDVNVNWCITSSRPDSYHCIGDVNTTIPMMKSIMQFVILSNKDKGYSKYIDLAPYRNNGSLRSIICPKIDLNSKTINNDNRHIIISNCHDIAQSIICNTTDTSAHFGVCYRRDYLIPVKAENTTFQASDIEMCLEELKRLDVQVSDYKVSSNYLNLVIKHTGSKCILCDKVHEKDNGYVVLAGDTFRYKCRRCIDPKAFKELGKREVTKHSEDRFSDQYHRLVKYKEVYSNVKYDKYSSTFTSDGDLTLDQVNGFKCHMTFVKSSLGTGKSKLVGEYLKGFKGSVVLLTFRRSFASAMCALYGLKSYTEYSTDKKKTIPLERDLRLAIQMESLYKLEVQHSPDLLIIDEAMSILMQLNSTHIRYLHATYQILYKLLNTSGKVIVMDALLSYPAMDLFRELTGNYDIDHYIAHNLYRREKVFMPVIVAEKAGQLYDEAYDKVCSYPLNAKIAVFATSVNMAKMLYEQLTVDGRRCVALYGDDTHSVIYKGETMIMKTLKDRLFSNVEAILQENDVFIYTSTLTAGISIEQTAVDCMITIFCNNTCNPIDCIQGTMRVRQQKDRLLLYIPGAYTKGKSSFEDMKPVNIALQLANSDTMMLPHRSLICAHRALDAQLSYLRDCMFIKMLVDDLGYDLDIKQTDISVSDASKIVQDTSFIDLLLEMYVPDAKDYKIAKYINEGNIDDPGLKGFKPNSLAITRLISFLEIYELSTERLYAREMSKEYLSVLKKMFMQRYKYRRSKVILDRYKCKTVEDYIDKLNSGVDLSEERRIQSVTLMREAIAINKLMKDNIDGEKDYKNGIAFKVLGCMKQIFADGRCVVAAEFHDILKPYSEISSYIVSKYPVKDINQHISNIGYNIETVSRRINGKVTRLLQLTQINRLSEESPAI